MLFKRLKKIHGDQEGTILVEALLALPVLSLLTFGILEYANLLWQRQQLQVGVRDAARYWSRCRDDDGSGPGTFMPCTQAIARNIAFTGYPEGGSPRVPGWDDASELSIDPATPSTTPGPTDLVTVSGTVTYQGSPVFAAVFDSNVTISYWATMRYIGW